MFHLLVLEDRRSVRAELYAQKGVPLFEDVRMGLESHIPRKTDDVYACGLMGRETTRDHRDLAVLLAREHFVSLPEWAIGDLNSGLLGFSC